MSAPRTVEHVVCLGCGCACDDVAIRVAGDRIVEARSGCPDAAAWFGDGRVPDRALIGGAAAPRAAAIARLADLLGAHRPALVYLAPELSVAAQREAAALADRLGARLDSVTSDTAAPGVLAAQRRGRATATLGEIRNRADLAVFWGVDPDQRHPRFRERFLPDPARSPAAGGLAARGWLAVDVGAARGPRDVAERLAIAAEREAIALAVMRAAVLGRELAGLPDELAAAAAAARRMAEARYVAMVHEADPDARDAADPQRAEGLIALAHALNAPTRCALVSLRAGGNRSGADAVLTWQTGYPMAIDMSAGYPQYHAHHPASALHGRIRAALVVGAAAAVPESVRPLLASVPVGIVGPRASEAPFAAEVAIDTGIAGIHEAGTAYRMDDVPLPLSQVLAGPPAPAEVLRELGGALAGRRRT